MELLEKLNKDEGIFLLDCGHSKRIDLVKQRKGLYKCQLCFADKIHEDAARIGLTCVSETVNGTRNLYKFDKCSHTVSLTPQNIRNSKDNLECKVCFNQKLSDGAVKNNLDILEGIPKPSRRLCKFKCCGLVKLVSVSSIINTATCPSCHIKSINSRIETETTLKIIPTSNLKRDYRLFELPCGHSKTIKIGAAKRNLWVCQECSPTSYAKKSSVYLLKVTVGNFSWLKVGYAHNIKNRVLHYGLVKGYQVEELLTIKFDSGFSAMVFEKDFHSRFIEHKLDPVQMNSYMRKSGFTECYPLPILHLLLAELHQLKEVKD